MIAMGTTLPAELLGILPPQLLASVVWAVAVCWVAWLLLRLIPEEETHRTAYRYLRPAIIWAAFLLALALLAPAAASYLFDTFAGSPPPPG